MLSVASMVWERRSSWFVERPCQYAVEVRVSMWKLGGLLREMCD